MDDNDFPEGDATSAAADAPGVVPTDDAPDRAPAAKQGGFDSASAMDAPVIRRSAKTAHTSEARKAFAAAMLESKSKPAPPPTGAAAELADLDPEAAPIAAKADVIAAKAAGATPAPAADIAAQALAAAAAPVAPPAPSLDPEVRRLKEQLQAERKQLEQERAEFAKTKTPATTAAAPVTHDALDLERYIDHAPKSFRTWLETMRGEPLTDDEFKAEMSDFITQASSDVLGVPLPENTRVRLEAALARKAVRTSKTIQTKREAEAATKAEAARKEAEERAANEELERQWLGAAHAVGQQFATTLDEAGKPSPSKAAAAYPWLAVEDDPGKLVVDVIRAAAAKDGTQMSWQEAAKTANDFLGKQSTAWHEKRKALLAPQPAPAAAPKPPVAPPPAPPAPVVPEQPRVPVNPSKWSREKHLENTKAAFRKMVSGGG